MRYTHKVSVWPVGLVGYLRYETPVLKNGKVSGVVLCSIYFKPGLKFSNFVKFTFSLMRV